MILQGRLIIDPALPPHPGWVRVEGAVIAEVGDGDPPQAPAAGGPDSFLSSGFIDAHVHLPQMDAIGCDGLELLEWLDRVIFPAEMRWADGPVADAAASAAYRRLCRAGTLGYAGFLTSHLHSAVAVTRAAHRLPLRAIAGQVLMDRHAPAALLGHDWARLARSARGRLAVSVNPRFAVSCSDELLARAARHAAGDGGAFVQTHLAETLTECDLVRKLFPSDPHYTAVYDRHGLLGPRTLLAHCLHLDEAEWALLAERRSVAVHCPAANTFLRAGVFDLGAARRHGVRVALGSDVAAGPDLAMPRVARAMIEVAKQRAMTLGGDAVPTPAEAWAMITAGNAAAMGFDGMGRLEAGADADLLVLRAAIPADEHLIGRLIYTWRDEYITHVVLNGRLIDTSTLA